LEVAELKPFLSQEMNLYWQELIVLAKARVTVAETEMAESFAHYADLRRAEDAEKFTMGNRAHYLHHMCEAHQELVSAKRALDDLEDTVYSRGGPACRGDIEVHAWKIYEKYRQSAEHVFDSASLGGPCTYCGRPYPGGACKKPSTTA
jgi:hypothetical protein